MPETMAEQVVFFVRPERQRAGRSRDTSHDADFAAILGTWRRCKVGEARVMIGANGKVLTFPSLKGPKGSATAFSNAFRNYVGERKDENQDSILAQIKIMITAPAGIQNIPELLRPEGFDPKHFVLGLERKPAPAKSVPVS